MHVSACLKTKTFDDSKQIKKFQETARSACSEQCRAECGPRVGTYRSVNVALNYSRYGLGCSGCQATCCHCLMCQSTSSLWQKWQRQSCSEGAFLPRNEHSEGFGDTAAYRFYSKYQNWASSNLLPTHLARCALAHNYRHGSWPEAGLTAWFLAAWRCLG